MQTDTRFIKRYFARLAYTSPRLSEVVNLSSRVLFGAFIGLLVALLVLLFTSWTGNDKFWVYAHSTVMVLLLRILGQLLWVFQLWPQVPSYLVADTEAEPDEAPNVSVEESQSLSLTAVILVTTGAATILATEDAIPDWASTCPGRILVPLVAGMIAGPLDALLSASTLYRLGKNRHPQQRDAV